MKTYPMNKYKYYIAGNRVIATTTYAGKTVRGYAKCSPNDVFALDKGKELAAARCALKVTKKRRKRAMSKMAEADIAMAKAEKFAHDMEHYLADSNDAVMEAIENLSRIESNM